MVILGVNAISVVGIIFTGSDLVKRVKKTLQAELKAFREGTGGSQNAWGKATGSNMRKVAARKIWKFYLERRKDRKEQGTVQKPATKKSEDSPKKKGPRSPPPWLQKQREKAGVAEAEAKKEKPEVSSDPARPTVDPIPVRKARRAQPPPVSSPKSARRPVVTGRLPEERRPQLMRRLRAVPALGALAPRRRVSMLEESGAAAVRVDSGVAPEEEAAFVADVVTSAWGGGGKLS